MSRLMSFIKESKDNFSRLLTSIFIILLLVILFSLQYRLWIGEGSLIEMFALQEKINQQEVKNNELIMQNQDLINQVNALKNGFDGVEARAREELGLIKSDETFFMVVDQPNSSKMISEDIWAIVPGAGIGKRFGGSFPKQYVNLNGKPIAQHSIERLIDANLFKKIIVVLDENDTWFESITLPSYADIEIVFGGDSRAQSVRNGLFSLESHAMPNDWVLIHDIVRPLITTAAIKKLFSEVSKKDVAAILATRINQTVKKTFNDAGLDKNIIIDKTLNRSRLWEAQTPQIVRYEVLCNALDGCSKSGIDVTDESMAVEEIGKDVLLIENSPSNIKITTQDDMLLAEFFSLREFKDLSK